MQLDLCKHDPRIDLDPAEPVRCCDLGCVGKHLLCFRELPEQVQSGAEQDKEMQPLFFLCVEQ